MKRAKSAIAVSAARIRTLIDNLAPFELNAATRSFARRPRARASKGAPNSRKPSTSSAPATSSSLPRGTGPPGPCSTGSTSSNASIPGAPSSRCWTKPHLDLTAPLGRGFIAFLSAMAEGERHRIVKRANEGRAAARKRGTRFGRKPKLTDHEQAEALKRMAAGESCRAIGRTMGVHHATIARLGVKTGEGRNTFTEGAPNRSAAVDRWSIPRSRALAAC